MLTPVGRTPSRYLFLGASTASLDPSTTRNPWSRITSSQLDSAQTIWPAAKETSPLPQWSTGTYCDQNLGGFVASLRQSCLLTFEIGSSIASMTASFFSRHLAGFAGGWWTSTAARSPTRASWHRFVQEHVGVDHSDTLHSKSKIDLMGTAYRIPAEAEAFDSALCTAVLEHLEEPELAFASAFAC